ncbi:hypothetical protein E4U42_008042 [Claviceps africana]|uniref:Quinate transporter n=1 Tax=Claviceps africana TaxID=83212 RepID=A0A8K0NJW0_9HYPO|nr:hypothetical protein E4U42_008042 [Claviceps africana]
MRHGRAYTGESGIEAPKEVYGYKVYLLALISSMGALMFGYDLGFIGTAIELESFQQKFGLIRVSKSEKAQFAANIVSLLQVGCILGSVAAGPASNYWGRRPILFLTALFFILGSTIQTASNGSWAIMFAGRVIGGIGVGAASMVVPLYVAEASPSRIRGRLIGVYEILVSAGTMLGFWINYGIHRNMPPTSAQWIISFAVQLIPASLLMTGLVLLPESPRHLASKQGREACLSALQRLRNIPRDHPYIQNEVHCILGQIQHDEAISEGSGVVSFCREVCQPVNRKRLITGCLMFIYMQMAGSNAINYYSPAIFGSIGLTGPTTTFFATGVYGIVRFVAIIIAMAFVVDRFGRTRTLMLGSFVMAFAMWYIGAYVKLAAPSSTSSSSHISSSGYAGIAMIYIYAVGWCFSWAGVPWIYAAEIFPLRIRSGCISICVTVHWILNFVIASSVPYMMANIGYGTYFVFAVSMTVSIPWVFFCVPETKNVSLEDMDGLFGMLPAGDSDSDDVKKVHGEYATHHTKLTKPSSSHQDAVEIISREKA